MIYLVDNAQFKVVFDKSLPDKALAISQEAQEQLRIDQVQIITGKSDGTDIKIHGHPFKVSETKINEQEAYEPVVEKTEHLLLSNLQWKVIKDEDQESELKFVEFV